MAPPTVQREADPSGPVRELKETFAHNGPLGITFLKSLLVVFPAISSALSTTTAGNISSMSAGDSEKKASEKKKRGRRRKPLPLGKNGKELSASAAKLRLLK